MANFDTHQHVNYKTAYIMTKGGGGGGGGNRDPIKLERAAW